jgi:cell wall-associated NlpC family hydrolase
MADQQKKPDESSSLLVTGIAGVIGIAILGIVGLAAYGLNGGNSGIPNRNGAQTVKAADPTNPAVTNVLNVLQAISDPAKTLASKLPLIDALKTKVDQMDNHYQADTGITGANRAEIAKEMEKVRQDIGALQAQINAAGQNSGTQLTQRTADIQAEVIKIGQLAYDQVGGSQRDRALALAITTATANNDGQYDNSGKVKYPYVFGKESLTAGFDCSGFITYILKTVGTLPSSEARLTTLTIPVHPGFSLIAGDLGTTSSTVPDNDILSQAAKGTIVPGDLLISGFGDNAHVVMYLGKPTGASEDLVAESTTKTGTGGSVKRSGPQRESLASRLTHGGAIRYVLRPPYHA